MHELYLYCINGQLNNIKELVVSNTLQKKYIYESVIIASEYGHLDIITYFITTFGLHKDDILIESNNINYNSALHVASINGHLLIIKYFAETFNLQITDFMAKDKCNMDTFTHAYLHGHLHIIKYLVEKFSLQKNDFIIYHDLNRILYFIVRYGHLELLKYIIGTFNLQKDDVIHIGNDNNIFMIISQDGYLEMLKYLIEIFNLHKNDVLMQNKWGTNILLNAITEDHIDIVKYLIHQFNLQKDDIYEQIKHRTDAHNILQLLFEKSLDDYLNESNYDKIFEICNITYISKHSLLNKHYDETTNEFDICKICYENKCNIKSSCNHSYCINCYIKLYHIIKVNDMCSFCRQKITNVITAIK